MFKDRPDPMKLNIVVPCYNEEAVLPEAIKQFKHLLNELIALGKISFDSQVTFVDDGSRDKTWILIEQASNENEIISGLKLSRNQGHQNAVLAGLLTVDGDAIVTIDADLQDDILVIEKMVDAYNEGVDVVYGVRADRSSDSFLKRTTATSFYRLLSAMGIETIHNHADFRLMSRKAIESLRQYPEINLYLRGIVPLIGLRSTALMYDRKERIAGESKYPLRKMLALAFEAITSFSTVPLQAITAIGLIIFVGAVVVSVWVLWVDLFTRRAVPGWTSTVLPMYLLGGIQILILGILGLYLGKIYTEVKRRPRYQIERNISVEYSPRSQGREAIPMFNQESESSDETD